MRKKEIHFQVRSKGIGKLQTLRFDLAQIFVIDKKLTFVFILIFKAVESTNFLDSK